MGAARALHAVEQRLEVRAPHRELPEEVAAIEEAAIVVVHLHRQRVAAVAHDADQPDHLVPRGRVAVLDLGWH